MIDIRSRFRKVLIALAILLLPGMFMTAGLVGTVSAQNFQGVCQGVAYTGDKCDDPNDTKAQSTLNTILTRGLQLFSAVVGIAGVIMVVFSGYRYITAGGDSSKITSAQQTLIYALVGLAVAGLAQILVIFVLDRIA